MKKAILLYAVNTALLCLFFLLLSMSAVAQRGVLKGVVRDTVSNEFAFVNLELSGPTSMFSSTGMDGDFLFENLKEGVYELKVTGLGYTSLTVTDIQIADNKVVDLSIGVTVAAEELESVTIVGSAITNTQMSVINEVKLGGQVISGVSQEQIKISQDRNAAQVMSRIPGVTVVDGRFIMVRGIPERYNQVLMNNAIAPSTEVDKRTFSFDLIPSSVLDRMMIYKSGAPENTGDFAGGLIKVYTANAADENYTEISLSGGFRPGTTGAEYIQSKGSSTDILGYDNGYRKLPQNFPSDNLRSLPNRSQKRVDAAHMLSNNFSPLSGTAFPDLGVGLSLSRVFRIGEKKISTITALNYGQSFLIYDKSFARYLAMDHQTKKVEDRFLYNDNTHEKDNRFGAISNWSLQLNENNRIEFKNLFNQIGENTTVIRTGQDYIQQEGLMRKNYMYQYRSRTVYSGQLEGTHKHVAFGSNAQLNWVLGLNYLGEEQPDLRRFRTVETAKKSGEYRMILPPSSNLFDAGRFYSTLKETGYSHGLNYKINLNKEDDADSENVAQLKLGYMIDYRSRSFDTRYFSYFYPGSSSLSELQKLEILALDKIFSNQNIKTSEGFLLEEGTRASDNYTSSNLLTAGYIGIVYPIGELTLSGGLRAEYNILEMKTKNDAGNLKEVYSPVLSPLFFFNSDYNLTEKTKIRLAYYRAVNRPEFRELAPILFYDYQFDAERYGNPNLITANIDNFDLRYEIYPRSGESISIGGFYKRFTNPIETAILIRSESPAYSYANAASAYSTGVELELRKSFRNLTNSRIVDNMSANINAAYIFSNVDYGDSVNVSGQEAKRALQGQSPYILNAILSYYDPETNWNASISYNVFGPRIFAVGSAMFPTIYEMPRHSLDLTVSKKVTKNWTAKIGIQDVLNSQYKFYQDTDRDTKIAITDGIDSPIFKYRKGTSFSLSFSYKF